MSTTPSTIPSTVPAGTNLAILVGTLSRDAELRTLPSGDHLVALELTVRRDGEAAESVPVAWPGAPSAAARWRAGDEVLVTGRVRRRFFRAAGATQSRTEVVAARVVPTSRKTAADKALRAAVVHLPL
jgi:single-strand DNA-binding protein